MRPDAKAEGGRLPSGTSIHGKQRCCAASQTAPAGRALTVWKLSTSKRLNPGLHLLQYTSGGLAMYVFLEQASHFPNSTGPAADLQFAAGQAPEAPGASEEHRGTEAAGGHGGRGHGLNPEFGDSCCSTAPACAHPPRRRPAEIPPPATAGLPRHAWYRVLHNHTAQRHAPRVPGSSSTAEARTSTAARRLRGGGMMQLAVENFGYSGSQCAR